MLMRAVSSLKGSRSSDIQSDIGQGRDVQTHGGLGCVELCKLSAGADHAVFNNSLRTESVHRKREG